MDEPIRGWGGRCSWVAVALAALFVVGCDDDGDDGGLVGDGRVLNVTMSGANEVPPVATLATGSVRSTLDGNTLVITGDFSGLESDVHEVQGSSAHLHRGGRDESGPITHNLRVSSSDSRSGTFSLTQELTTDELADYAAGLLYVNVHTMVNPTGELRAQLTVQSPTEQRFDAAMTGAQEVPPVSTSATGSVHVDRVDNVLTLVGSFSGLSTDLVADPTGQAHIHRAPLGQSGAILIPLTVMAGADNRSGSFRAAVDLSADLVSALEAGELYVNVHSQAHPAGEIRAQLVEDGTSTATSAPTPQASPTPQY